VAAVPPQYSAELPLHVVVQPVAEKLAGYFIEFPHQQLSLKKQNKLWKFLFFQNRASNF